MSFSIEHRQYAGRAVYHFSVPNPDGVDAADADDTDRMRFVDDHDPMNF
ncbi:hypothetical protein OZX74_06995 [Bifidobacterium sp. ESL0798]|nr:hypothetical protein [Bifidobacterium sp. ESL0798]WEV73652.1 hypothetical protein OZX74_06995 [Bifidobacterium sp. ESL0798]